MSSAPKKAKVGPHPRPPTCKYEKARRDRLNLFITELSTFLPEQNPAKTFSKIDILEKIVQLIKRLLEDKEKLANKNSTDDCLKQELKELKTTVSDLKARIVTLNKILKEANITVPLDLEVLHFDKNFTPHLRYSCRKRALNNQFTQTEQTPVVELRTSTILPETICKDRQTHEKENQEESVEKLISFTKKLKPPLQEIQSNLSEVNNKVSGCKIILPPPPLLPHVAPAQIIVVPYLPNFFPTPPLITKRPALTHLTFSNKRPITSYTDFKKIFNKQQEKLALKKRRRRQKRKQSLKKCTCQAVVLKKADGTLKKIVKLCGYKACKNQAKFHRIQEQTRQQMSELSKEKAKESRRVSPENKSATDLEIHPTNRSSTNSEIHHNKNAMNEKTHHYNTSFTNHDTHHVNRGTTKQEAHHLNVSLTKHDTQLISGDVTNHEANNINGCSTKNDTHHINGNPINHKDYNIKTSITGQQTFHINSSSNNSSQHIKVSETNHEENHISSIANHETDLINRSSSNHLNKSIETSCNASLKQVTKDFNPMQNEQNSLSMDNVLYSEQQLMVNLHNTATYQDKRDASNKHLDKFEKTSKHFETENTHYEFVNPSQHSNKLERSHDEYYFPCNNYFTSMESGYDRGNDTINYQNIKQDASCSDTPRLEAQNINSDSANMNLKARENGINMNEISYPNQNTLPDKSQRNSDLIQNANQSVASSSSCANINHLNVVSHSIESLNQKSSIKTCVESLGNNGTSDSSYTNRNNLQQIERPREEVTGKSMNNTSNKNIRDIVSSNNGSNVNTISSNNNNMRDCDVNSQDVGSYSINSVIFSRSCSNEVSSSVMYQSSNREVPESSFNSYCEQNPTKNIMPHKLSDNLFHDQRECIDQKVVQSNDEIGNVHLNKRSVKKNLAFSFENLGSNVMSSDVGTGFGYNASTDAGSSTIYPLQGQLNESSYNTSETHVPSFSFKSNTLLSGDMPYVEPAQEKSSCYFESHPNALHFPYVPVTDKSLAPATKSYEEKRKSGSKQKEERGSHDISQNIFELNNKENSFDFLFGKQNSLNTPQKNKRKNESCLMSDKTFLLDEMKFHSEFSNDLFSLPGQVGGQNLECVSPTAAFLLAFPVVSSKQAELLTDNLESGNTTTPIGNIESLSQDLTDFTFKSNIKGLFDPLYPSCIGAEFNTVENVSREDLLTKTNFPSFLEITGSSSHLTMPWSANIFNNEDSPKKKIQRESTSSKIEKGVETKSQQNTNQAEEINSKCSQTLFSYTGGLELGSNSKALVNWMTSGDKSNTNTQDGKKPTDVVTQVMWVPNKAIPAAILSEPTVLETKALPISSSKPATSVASNFSIALFSNTMSSNNQDVKSRQEVPASSTLGFYGDTKSTSYNNRIHREEEKTAQSHNKSSNQRQKVFSYLQNNSGTNERTNKPNDSNVPCKKYASNLSSFDIVPDSLFQDKSAVKSCEEVACPSAQIYYPNSAVTTECSSYLNPPANIVCSTSSFLSVSQLVDPGKPETKAPLKDQVQSISSKLNLNQKEGFSRLVEPFSNDNKCNNYSTEAILSSPLKFKHQAPVVPDLHGKVTKSVETKTKYKRKISNSKSSKNNVMTQFSNIYNVAPTSGVYSVVTSSASYSNPSYYPSPSTSNYNSYYTSSDVSDKWKQNNSTNKASTNSTYGSFDNTKNNQLYVESTGRENYIPFVSQNYYPSTISNSGAVSCTTASSYYQNPIFTYSNQSNQSYVTSVSYVAPSSVSMSQHSDSKTKELNSAKISSNINQTTSKAGSASVGTQVVTSSFDYKTALQYKSVSAPSNMSSTTNTKAGTSFKPAVPSSRAPSGHLPVTTSPTCSHSALNIISFSSSDVTRSSSLANTSSSIVMPSNNPSFVSFPITSTSHSSVPEVSLATPDSITFTNSHSNLLSTVSSIPSFSTQSLAISSISCASNSSVLTTSITSGVGLHMTSIPPPIPSVLCTTVTYSSYGTSCLVPPPYSRGTSLYSGQKESFSDTSLYTPASSVFYASGSSSLPSTKGSLSSFLPSLPVNIPSSTLSSVTLQSSSVTSSPSFSSFNPPLSTNVSSVTFNSSIISPNPPYSLPSSSKTSSASSSMLHQQPVTPNSSACVSFSSLDTPVISSSIPHFSPNNPSTSPNVPLFTLNTSKPLSSSTHSYLSTSVTSSVSYETHKNSTISSSLNTPTTSFTVACFPLNTPKTSSNVSHKIINTPITTTILSYTAHHTTKASISYSTLNTLTTSSSVPYFPLSIPKTTTSTYPAPVTLSSQAYTSLNTPDTMSNSLHSLINNPKSSSVSYSTLNTPSALSNIPYFAMSTPKTSLSSSYTPINNSATSYLHYTTPKTTSISYSGPPINSSNVPCLTLTTPKTLSSLSLSSLHTTKSSSLSYKTPKTSVIPFSGLNNTPRSSSFNISHTSLDSSKTSSAIPYSLHVPVSSYESYSTFNTPACLSNQASSIKTVTSSTASYQPLYTPMSSSSITYSSATSSKASPTVSYQPFNTPANSSNQSSSMNTITSSTASHQPHYNPMSSSSITHSLANPSKASSTVVYQPFNSPASSSNQNSSIKNITSSTASYQPLYTPMSSSSITYTSANLSKASSTVSYQPFNTPASSCSRSYSDLNTAATSSVLSFSSRSCLPSSGVPLSSRSILTTSSSMSSYSAMKPPAALTGVGFSSLSGSVPLSVVSFSSLISSALPSSSMSTISSYSNPAATSTTSTSVPYSVNLNTPVTSSVTDFNLSTIFPEINVTNQSQGRGSQSYPHEKNYQRSSKSAKSGSGCDGRV